jgi:hypothetical protein
MDVGERDTVTLATGIGFTVMAGVGPELIDSLLAVIVALPTPTAVIVTGVPLAVTVTTAVLLDDQVMGRPVSELPFASAVVALSCWLAPTIIGVVGADTVTVATGASVTVTADMPAFPSLVAVIVVVPAPTAVTNPFPSTLAAAALLVVHETARPTSAFPPASSVTAVIC